MNNFKKILLFFILIFSTANIWSQKDLSLSQYMQNQFVYNPAFAGSRETFSAFIAGRKQWMNFPEAPTGAYITAHSLMKNTKVGLGIDIFSEKYTVVKNQGFALSYAYRMKMKNNKFLALGLKGGMQMVNSDWTQIDVIESDDYVFGESEKKAIPTVGFGASIYCQKYFVSLSAPSLFSYNSASLSESKFEPGNVNYFFSGGYLFEISQDFHIQPSLMAKVNPSQTSTVDATANFIFLNTVWAGASYRTTGDIVTMLGFQFTQQLKFTYSFDYSTNKIEGLNNNSHEISLQYDFGYKINSTNPKFF